MISRVIGALAVASALSHTVATGQGEPSLQRRLLEIASSIDGSRQPAYLFLPAGFDSTSSPRALAVLLHTWSNDLNQRFPTAEAAITDRGWLLLVPNFRGRNDHPEACGSALAQQDVLDAIGWVERHYPVDRRRLYLLGLSGGGYMTLLLAGRHPQPWAAASAWVPISNLATWYRAGANNDYRTMMRQCFGGPPDANDSLHAEYQTRSPLRYLSRASAVPLELAAGLEDSVVPMRQTVDAFGVLAKAAGERPVTEAEMSQLLTDGRLASPAIPDTAADQLFGRRIVLRRMAGNTRLTIFEGGHEWLPRAAVAWLSTHRKP
jgi:poly(3-hydroxybutyrate) depolymerase